MFGPGGLCYEVKYHVPEDRNEGGRVATPTSFLLFDSYDMKSLWGEFGYEIFTGFKMAVLQVGLPFF